jgi:hypothetical protein
MNKRIGLLLLLVVLLAVLSFVLKNNNSSVTSDSNRISKKYSPGFAVVELFTSEGCSSCPPAENLVNRFEPMYDSLNEPVYFVNFHVDYWNTKSWNDPFSDAAYSAHQRWYASLHNSSDVYTPQTRVNGGDDFVGSDESKTESEINSALDENPKATIILKSNTGDSGNLIIQYQLSGDFKNAKLNFALSQLNLTSHVKGGENKDRTLYHYSVVSKFYSIMPLNAGNYSIPNNAFKDGTKYKLLAFLQDNSSGKIISAKQILVYPQ